VRYLSVCSGIEAATVAWHPLGWAPWAFSEVDPFASALLSHYYPAVPNLGDMTAFRSWPHADLDVLVGGTPCQSFSVAGALGSIRRGDAKNETLLATSSVRRLTPRECERLQGFPDDYTLIPVRGKPAADGPRYKALGNSMAVPVMRWLGERISLVASIP
jgi:site-specific DNA-cytosine methylase